MLPASQGTAISSRNKRDFRQMRKLDLQARHGCWLQVASKPTQVGRATQKRFEHRLGQASLIDSTTSFRIHGMVASVLEGTRAPAWSCIGSRRDRPKTCRSRRGTLQHYHSQSKLTAMLFSSFFLNENRLSRLVRLDEIGDERRVPVCGERGKEQATHTPIVY
jgi:hypothetical protein